MWDQRYNTDYYAYGKASNDFLVEVIDRIPKGRILSLAEGEGRNAVYLAQQGYEVTAVDASSVGLSKAHRLAAERRVRIATVETDLADYEIKPEMWEGVISIFCHLPPALRAEIHRKVVAGLRPGGVFVVEAYTPKQLEFNTGGPPTVELMMDLETLTRELSGLHLVHAVELERNIHEGKFHDGRSAVVQVFGIK